LAEKLEFSSVDSRGDNKSHDQLQYKVETSLVQFIPEQQTRFMVLIPERLG